MIAANAVLVNGYDLAQQGLASAVWSGVEDSPRRRILSTTLPGRDGGLVGWGDLTAGTKDVVVTGTLLAISMVARVAQWDAIKGRLEQGLLELVFGDSPDKRLLAYCVGAEFQPASTQMADMGGRVTLTFMAPFPYRESIEPVLVGFTSASTPAPVGTGPSSPVIQLMGGTNPLLTYRDQSGVIRAQMALTIAVPSDAFLEIDMNTATIKQWQGGVYTNKITALAAGTFFALEGRDADVLHSQWPTLEVSSGTGVALYRKAWV
jgi:phage-related protein